MIRKIFFIIIALLISCISVGAYFILQKDDSVYFKVIETPFEEQPAPLGSSLTEWTKQKDRKKGVHLYSFDSGNPYEFIFYDNTDFGENLYNTSKISAKLYDDLLRIDIDEKYASDENFVNDRILAYFIIKEKPATIEVYRNGVQELYEMENGDEAITK